MIVKELIAMLQTYDEESKVEIFDDWGSGYVLHPISNVLDTTEFEQSAQGKGENPIVVLCFEVGEQGS